MYNRRRFLTDTFLGSLLLSTGLVACNVPEEKTTSASGKGANVQSKGLPVVLATWENRKATATAMNVLKTNGRALDAVEAGARLVEADPNNITVGYGGLPDRDGIVTLDACIMDENGNAGSVAFLTDIMHPVSVARKVMEKTPHVILSGDGALQFALAEGFERQNLLTPQSEKAWKEWLKKAEYQPTVNIERHDTIGILAIDAQGNISGACTTSGLAYKMHGRVGDSPIIGAGLYVDNEVGGACATGMGEMVLKTLGSFLIVELMRNGRTPQEACEEAVKRMVKKYPALRDEEIQVGFCALDKKGNHGAYSVLSGFNISLFQNNQNDLLEATYMIKQTKKEE